MTGRQHPGHGRLRFPRMAHVGNFHVDAGQFGPAHQPHDGRPQWHHHLAVDIIFRKRRRFGGQHTDHPVGYLADQNVLAHGLAMGAEQRLAHRLSQHGHLAQIVLVHRVQRHPLAHLPVQCLRKIARGGTDPGLERTVAMPHHRARLVDEG